MTSNTKSCLKGIGDWGVLEQGKTIHNLGVNHTIKNVFGISILYQINLELKRGEIAADSWFN
jgi:hypothetical protein